MTVLEIKSFSIKLHRNFPDTFVFKIDHNFNDTDYKKTVNSIFIKRACKVEQKTEKNNHTYIFAWFSAKRISNSLILISIC